MNSPRGRNTLVLVILVSIVAILVIQFRAGAPQPARLYLNEVAREIAAGNVSRVVVDENNLEVIFRDGQTVIYEVDRETRYTGKNVHR